MDESNVSDNTEEIKKQEKLIKRHAQESWIYPIVSVALNIFGYPIAFLNNLTFILGLYCLIKSYINIKNGRRQGIIGHVVTGTILNILFLAINILVIYAVVNGSKV